LDSVHGSPVASDAIESILTAWQAYVQALVATLDVEAREALQTELLGWARAVAAAAGGILGFGSRISQAEQANKYRDAVSSLHYDRH